MLYRISVTERGLTGIANIFRSRLSRLDDLLGAGTVPLTIILSSFMFPKPVYQRTVHVASHNYDVINLIYNVIEVTWHHL